MTGVVMNGSKPRKLTKNERKRAKKKAEAAAKKAEKEAADEKQKQQEKEQANGGWSGVVGWWVGRVRGVR